MSHICHHIHDPAGKDLGHRISNRDITERKRLEAEIVKARNLEALGILAGGIVHDFNNLFHGFLGNIELTKMEVAPASRANTFLEKAEQMYTLATTLTGQLIAFSPGGNVRPTNLRPAGLIKEEVLAAIEGSSLVAAFDIAADLWSIRVDTSQFRNVIKHMALNAREAMPAGAGGTLTITAANVSVPALQGKHPLLAPGNYVRISVQDHGGGIRKEDLPRIFDSFGGCRLRIRVRIALGFRGPSTRCLAWRRCLYCRQVGMRLKKRIAQNRSPRPVLLGIVPARPCLSGEAGRRIWIRGSGFAENRKNAGDGFHWSTPALLSEDNSRRSNELEEFAGSGAGFHAGGGPHVPGGA